MTSERVREMLKAEPFRPFIIHLVDGRELIVQHPELLALSPSGRTAVVFQPNDAMTIIDLHLVTELEVKPESAQSQST